MKITIKSIPQREHRYATVGDYWRDTAGNLEIRVTEMAPVDMVLVALHELIEVTLAEHRGIDEAKITAFDMRHPELEEPGESPMAPYHKEHVFAETIERLMALELECNWQQYSARLSALFP